MSASIAVADDEAAETAKLRDLDDENASESREGSEGCGREKVIPNIATREAGTAPGMGPEKTAKRCQNNLEGCQRF